MIYLDYNATTPVAQAVLEEMLPYFTTMYGNAASRTHLAGWDALEGVNIARERLARFLGVSTGEIVFTSGATEAVNLAIKGLYEKQQPEGKQHIITAATEHKAVLDTCRYLEQHRGASLTYLPVDGKGHINLDDLEKAITANTLMVALMQVNNETGLVHPVAEIGRICHQHGVAFFCDATQAAGKIPLQPAREGITLMALSAHKMYGPKGVGALYVARDTDLMEQLHGGGHERKRRSGTLNVPGIVGLGKAAELAAAGGEKDTTRLMLLRNRLEKALMRTLAEVVVNGDATNRVAHVSNLHLKGVEAEKLMLALGNHVAISSGAACTSAAILPSHVLKAMGLTDEEALSSIRISLGRLTTEAEIDQAAEKIIEAAARIRNS